MWVGECTVNDAAGVGPKRTPVATSRSVPWISTTVPPDTGPFLGVMDVTAGMVGPT